MPLMFGILMSVTITSKSADSSFFLAASPELTVSTLYPSRRRVISSISQMERSSSQIRILGMRTFSYQPLWRRIGSLRMGSIDRRRGDPFFPCFSQAQNECATLPRFRSDKHLALVGLYDLINDCQPQSGPA